MVYTLLYPRYSQCFGFTETEVSDLLKQANLHEKAVEIGGWYNGYIFGKTVVYNPWYIVNCIQENGRLRPYFA